MHAQNTKVSKASTVPEGKKATHYTDNQYFRGETCGTFKNLHL